jgi:hypothetical protein
MISKPEYPVRLILPADWRVLGFGLALALGVTALFGLSLALRASGVRPASALKGGDHLRAQPRTMQTPIAIQVAFCFVVLFLAGLFLATSRRLSHQQTRFSDERVLTLETLTTHPQPPALWEQVAEHLRTVPGIEAVATSEWPLMTGESWNGFISVNGAPPGPVASYFLSVSPGWLDVMKIALAASRDFRVSDTLPRSAIVNQAFAKQYFGIENPLAKSFEVVTNEGRRVPYQVVGLVGDVRYKDMREPIQPITNFL